MIGGRERRQQRGAVVPLPNRAFRGLTTALEAEGHEVSPLPKAG